MFGQFVDQGDARVRDTLTSIYNVHGRKLRFLVVGVWNTAFSYGVFVVLLYALGPVLRPLAASDSVAVRQLGTHWYLAAQWASWVVAVPQSTLALKHLVFRSAEPALPEIGRAYFVYLPMQAVSTVLLWFFVTMLGLHPLPGQLLTIGISAVMSYLGHKHFTFRTPPAEPPAPLE